MRPVSRTPFHDPDDSKKIYVSLTIRRVQVLRLLSESYKESEIADYLGVSEKSHTVAHRVLKAPGRGSLDKRACAVVAGT